MRTLRCLGLLCLLGLAARALSAAEWYVAPDGDDAHPGTRAQPFATLDRARDAVRRFRAEGGRAPATVWIRRGIYRVTQPFVLGPADSGAPGAPVTYRAVPGEVVRLSGGVPLQREWFAPVTDAAILSRIISPEARRALLAVNLRVHGIAGLGEITRRGYHRASERYQAAPSELFIGGRRMTLARWPNDATVSRTRIIDPGPKGVDNSFTAGGAGDPDFWERGGTFAYDFDRPEKWPQAQEIWLSGILSWSWEWTYNKVAAIDTAKKQMTLRYGEVSGVFDAYSGNRFHFENLLEEIDAPGEYYIDRAAGILYLLPPPGFDEPGVEIELTSHAGPLVQARGASFVVLRDLVFELSRGRVAVEVIGGEGVGIEHCEVRRCGGGGIVLQGKNHRAAHCLVHDVGETGIALRGGKFDTLEPGGCVAEDNEIHHFGEVQRVYTPGIALGGVGHVGLRAAHNHIHHGPHVGILSWGNDHLIEGNDIHDVVLEFTDMGAIDFNSGARPFERGTVVRRNFIHHIGVKDRHQNGVYADNFTMGIRIEENFFYRIGGKGRAADSRAVNINTGAHIIVRHNLFVDCSFPCNLDDHAGRVLYEQTLPQWKAHFKVHRALLPLFEKRYPELSAFWQEPRQFPDTNRFEGNIILNGAVPRVTKYGREDVIDGVRDARGLLRRTDNFAGDTPAGLVAADGSLQLSDAVFGLVPGFPRLSPADAGPRGGVGPHAEE